MQAVQPMQATNKPNRGNAWRTACAAILLCIAAAISAPAQTFTTLTTFNGTDGGNPHSLVQGIDGNFYGVATTGGNNKPQCSGGGGQTCGLVFKITPSGTLTGVSPFCESAPCVGGFAPTVLIRSGNGGFYGITLWGGANSDPSNCPNGCGTVFKLTSNGTQTNRTTLYSFCALANCADGWYPQSLTQAFGGGVYGDLYGTTAAGGANGIGSTQSGTAFRITPQGQFTTVHNFCALANCADGSFPISLIQSAGGTFYGLTRLGGCLNCGTFFRMTPSGTLTTLHIFNGGSQNGSLPNAPLVQGTSGLFYGTTNLGGNKGSQCPGSCGMAFEVSSGGNFATLYDFCSQPNCPDGYNPEAGVMQATDGNFYGVTYGNNPVIYRVTPSGQFTTLYTFCTQCGDGEGSSDLLVQGTDGKFYGTSFSGGSKHYGTIFSLDVGLAPFVEFLIGAGNVGTTVGILGQGFTGTTAVSFNGTPASFNVRSDSYLTATVPAGATTGTVTVTTTNGTLSSNVVYHVTP